jgi:hypothetical protein
VGIGVGVHSDGNRHHTRIHNLSSLKALS